MSIADKLTYMGGTETAIREAIEAKGVSVPDGTTFRQYADKIADISSGGGGPADIDLIDEWSQDFYDYVKEQVDALDLSYVRPADWIEVPVLRGTEHAFYGLYAVWEDQNTCAVYAAGTGLNVDWGDGSSESLSSGVVTYHTYNYSTLGNLSDRGYKQALVSITGTSITAIRACYAPISGLYYLSSAKWLDIECSLPSGTLALGRVS